MEPKQHNFLETTFRGINQKRKFEELSKRNIGITLYHDEPTMNALGILDSVMYLFNQLGWEKALIKTRFATYRELTFEFLSSLVHLPEHGKGTRKGFISFRLFGINFVYNHKDLADLLGFPSGPFAFSTTQVELMDIELDYFWGTLTGNYHPDPDNMDNDEIHNPAIRYFHKMLAHTVFGKEENQTAVSKDEIFLLYCMHQGHPINAVPFLMQTFYRIIDNPDEPIIIGGLVTMIAHALGLRHQLNRCPHFGTIRPMNLAFCFNRRMIANHAYPPYDYLIRDEVVNLFTLPNHNKVSVHNRDNWLYELNPPDQPPTSETPQDYQIYDDIMSDMGDPETPPGYYENVNMAEAHAAPETTTKDYTDNQIGRASCRERV